MAGLHERAVAINDTIACSHAIGRANDYRDIEQGYQASPTSVTVIDEFLSQEALNNLRRYCHDSTIFFAHNATSYVTS
tara:strand:+ start:170 stop:403 length:234 start_codon:yes stop_codon:yes gene_type:complete